MPKYFPITDGIEYQYEDAANGEKIVIKSYWKVDLSANETIEAQRFVDTGSNILYVELYVKSTGGPASDHTWQGSADDIVICRDKIYDPAVTVELSAQQNAVRDKIMNLLDFYRSNNYEVIANVTQANSIEGNKGTNTISGSGVIGIV